MKPRPGPYRVRSNSLWFRDEELLSGPLLQLELIARVLNACRPREPDLAATLQALVRMTRDTQYLPGPRLLALGASPRIIMPQRRSLDGGAA